MNKTSLIAIALCTLITIACQPSKKERAEKLLAAANQAIATKDYNSAKLKIDSISLCYPEEIETIGEGKILLLRLELTEQKQSLAYYDTLIVKRKATFEELSKSFVYKEGKFKGYAGTYTHKRQQVKNSHDRTFIKAYLDEKGDFYISSHYHSKSHIYHNSIKVYNDGLFAKTEAIPSSSFDNRSFDDGEDYWETVNYRNNTDHGVVSFIVNNYDKTLKVEYIGKKHYYIVMEQFDKEAIRDAYNLSLVIKELSELETNKITTEKRLQELNSILANQKL